MHTAHMHTNTRTHLHTHQSDGVRTASGAEQTADAVKGHMTQLTSTHTGMAYGGTAAHNTISHDIALGATRLTPMC